MPGQADQLSKTAINTMEEHLQENGRINALGEQYGDDEQPSGEEPQQEVELSRTSSSESALNGDASGNTKALIRETINGWFRAGVDIDTILDILEEHVEQPSESNEEDIHSAMTGGSV
jgi:hypothetical protein